MSNFEMFSIATIVILIFLYCECVFDKREILKYGKIEIKITDEEDDRETNTFKQKNLILEIKYRLVSGAKYNKEESAVLINDMVQSKCRQKGFRVRDNSKKTLKEIKDIMEKIKLLLPRGADAELIDVRYKFFSIVIPIWPEDVFY